MFYANSIENRLRFGDVLKGYLLTAPNIAKPFGEKARDPYSIDVCMPDLSVVLDPCCEIGRGSLSLAPLAQINPNFWDNPCLFENMTRINRKGMPKDFIHPELWNKKSDAEKIQAMSVAPDYGHRSSFTYEGNSQFTEYDVDRSVRFAEVIDPVSKLPKFDIIHERRTFKTRSYMIDFRSISHVNCEKIRNHKETMDKTVIDSIVLQLSIDTRNELRDKMAAYFGVPPEEDLPKTRVEFL